MIVALAIAAAFATAALLALAVAKATRQPGRHEAAKPPPGIRITAFLAEFTHAMATVNGLRADDFSDFSDEDKELWVDGLVDRKTLGPPAPARRPQLLTVARVRAASIIRAVPLDQIPWLRPGQGYSDTTGSFAAITDELPGDAQQAGRWTE